MKISAFLLSFFFLLNFSFGQTKKLSGVLSSNGDTSFWYKYHLKQLEKLSMPALDTVSNTEHYRIWTTRQIIDIWQNSNGTIGGNLTTWTEEYDPENKEQ